MDSICDMVASEVNAALRYPLRFHKVNKIVVCLGRGPRSEPDYIEQLGVGLKQWPSFDLDAYVLMDAKGKVVALRAVVLETFDWLERNFDDAQFVAAARENLGWAS